MNKNKVLYYSLIVTFSILYIFVSCVSTIHAISFFQLGNSLTLAIMLGLAFEIGQSSILFAILLTDHKNRFLPWFMMILLTCVQVSANVFASFKFMDQSGSNDWSYWQRAILFWIEEETPEMYKVIISWIQGGILPLVALGLTSLVADALKNMKNKNEINIDEDISDEDLDSEEKQYIKEDLVEPKKEEEKQEVVVSNDNNFKQQEELKSDIDESKQKKEKTKKKKDLNKQPVNKVRGWHLLNEYVDDEFNVFSKGKFIENNKLKVPYSKKE